METKDLQETFRRRFLTAASKNGVPLRTMVIFCYDPRAAQIPFELATNWPRKSIQERWYRTPPATKLALLPPSFRSWLQEAACSFFTLRRRTSAGICAVPTLAIITCFWTSMPTSSLQ